MAGCTTITFSLTPSPLRSGASAKVHPGPWASSSSAKGNARAWGRPRSAPSCSARHRAQPISTCRAAIAPAPAKAASAAKAGSPGRAEAPNPTQNNGPLASTTSASPQPRAATKAVSRRVGSRGRARATQAATSSPPTPPQTPHTTRHSGRLRGAGTPIQSKGCNHSSQRWLTRTAAAPHSEPASSAVPRCGEPATAQSMASAGHNSQGQPTGGRATPARTPPAMAARAQKRR